MWRTDASCYSAHVPEVERASRYLDRLRVEMSSHCRAELSALDLGAPEAVAASLRRLHAQAREWTAHAVTAATRAVTVVEMLGAAQLSVFVAQRLWWYVHCVAFRIRVVEAWMNAGWRRGWLDECGGF